MADILTDAGAPLAPLPPPLVDPPEPLAEVAETDPALQVAAAVNQAIAAARPTPPVGAPVANVIVSAEGGSVVFSLPAPTQCHMRFEAIGQGVPPGQPLLDRYLPAILQRTDVVEDLNAPVPVLRPAPMRIEQDGAVALSAGRYSLSLQDFVQGRLWVIGVSQTGG